MGVLAGGEAFDLKDSSHCSLTLFCGGGVPDPQAAFRSLSGG
jgi:hypothetical protein